MVTRGKEVGEMGRCLSKGTNVDCRRMNKCRDLTYSMMTVINNTVLHTGNVMEILIGLVVIILLYLYQFTMLCTSNIHNFKIKKVIE